MGERRVPVITFFLLLLAIDGSRSSPDRIVGGDEIPIEKVPFMLSIRENGQHICGASILTKHRALTAAHCVKEIEAKMMRNFTVQSGSSKWKDGGEVHDVTDFSYHENYDPNTNDYDLGIITIDPPFDFNDRTQPVMLLKKGEEPDREWGLVSGWGNFLEFDPILSEDLEYVILPMVSKEECQKDYEGRYVVTPRQICYGFRRGVEDACKGDSGGAIISKKGILLGVTSWGDGCGEHNSPGVYTDAIVLQDWIQNRLDED